MTSQGLLTLDEAAKYMGVAKITLRRWTRAGHLTCVRIGKRGDRRFRKVDLDSYIDGRKAPGLATKKNVELLKKKVLASGRRQRRQ